MFNDGRCDRRGRFRVGATDIGVGHDALYLYKAAIEGSNGATDGKTIVTWIETKASTAKNTVVGPCTPTPVGHFLFGPDVLTMAEKFDQPRSDTLFFRAGC